MARLNRRAAAPPRSPGRPRKLAEEVRSEVIVLRVSMREKAIIEKNADGRELSAFLRQAGMAQQQPARVPLANREISGHLSRWGNNLNQLVRLAHTGRFPAHLEALLQRLYDLIIKWRRELLGEPE